MVEMLLNDQMYNVTYIAQCNWLWHFKYSKADEIYEINLQNWVLLAAKIPFAAAFFGYLKCMANIITQKGKTPFLPF
jgi:hypothetical protein